MVFNEVANMYYEYLDMPAPPMDLIDTNIDDVLALENIFLGQSDRYTMHDCPDRLKNWLKPVFPDHEYFMYQTIRDGLPIHIDTGRPGAINFIIDTGGDNVETVWYADDQKTIIAAVALEPFRWHSLTVDIYHTVRNVTGIRFAITVY